MPLKKSLPSIPADFSSTSNGLETTLTIFIDPSYKNGTETFVELDFYYSLIANSPTTLTTDIVIVLRIE